MQRYNTTQTQFDPGELDPCIAAEVRFKKQFFTLHEAKYILCFILFVLSFLLLAAGLLMVFGRGDSDPLRSSQFELDLTSQMPGFPLDYDEDEDSEFVDDRPEEFKLHHRNSTFTASPPLLSGGLIHTSPIHESKLKLGEQLTSDPYDLPSIAKPPAADNDERSLSALPNPINAAPPWDEPTKPSSIPLTSTTYSIRGDEILDVVPILKKADLSKYQQKYDQQSIDKIEEHCEQYRQKGHAESGVYKLAFASSFKGFKALCLMEPDYAWTVLQRRTGPEVPFWNSTMDEYINGFGDPAGDHWLGLERIYGYVARNHKLQLRIVLRGDLCNKGKRKCSAEGENGFWWGDWDFSLTDSADNYRLINLRYLRGNLSDPKKPAADIFTQMSNNQQFTTVDSDNDWHTTRNGASFRHKG